MRAAEVMTKDVVSVGPDESILEAARLMLQRKISGLPVVDTGGNLVGIVTEGDFLRRAELGTGRPRPRWLEFLVGPGRLAAEYTQSHGRKVSEVMTADPWTVTEDTPLGDIVELMERRHVKRTPVTRGTKIVGIVTRASLVRALVGLARKARLGAETDATIREAILAVLKNEPWAPVASIDITVHDGTVDLWGTIMDERARQALIVAIENVAGVKEIKDHLAWIEPASGMVIEKA
jgi:CBS domain-containing protein